MTVKIINGSYGMVINDVIVNIKKILIKKIKAFHLIKFGYNRLYQKSLKERKKTKADYLCLSKTSWPVLLFIYEILPII